MSDSAIKVTARQSSIETPISRKISQLQSAAPLNQKEKKTAYSLNSTQSLQRARLEQFISERFSNCYGAAIVEFFPLLLARSNGDAVSSVVGLRPGTDRPLFLEQYLQTSLEQAITGQVGTAVDRERIMEIGNLASSYKSGNQLMFVLLTAILAKAGYSWVVFTATVQVRSLLKRLDFHPVTLCEADESKLVNKHQAWGSYYQSQPLVQAGNVADGLKILESNSYTQMLLGKHESEIASLADQLCTLRTNNRSAE